MRKITATTSLEEILARYPRLAAHLICESLGYFTPHAAANAIKHYVLGMPFYCEWYVHMAGPSREAVIAVGRQVLERAVRYRHRHRGFMAHYPLARAIVKDALQGHGPIFASWF